MTSKASRKRNRKARGINREMEAAANADLAPRIQTAEDPRKVVLDTRARQFSRKPAEVDSPIWGCPAGQAIAIACGRDEAAPLWDTFKALDGADDTYSRRVLGIQRFAAVSKLEFLPERFETRADDRPDTRTAAERDRDAVNAWMRWQGYLGHLDRDQHSVIVCAMRHRARLSHGGRLTRVGGAFIAALRVLDSVVRRG